MSSDQGCWNVFFKNLDFYLFYYSLKSPNFKFLGLLEKPLKIRILDSQSQQKIVAF